MDGTLLAVEVTKIATLVDGSISISLCTSELSPGKVAELFALRKAVCYAYFSAKHVEHNERQIIDSMEPELKGKTPGQRLHSIMYLKFKNDPEGYKDSNSYYLAKMESIIEHHKQDLP